MALVIGKKTTRKIKVTAEEPLDFAGVNKHIFDVEFKLLSETDLNGIADMSNAGEEEVALDGIFGSIVDVQGVKDETGADVPFSKELVQVLRDTVWVRRAINQFFWSVQRGVTQPELYKAMKAKN